LAAVEGRLCQLESRAPAEVPSATRLVDDKATASNADREASGWPDLGAILSLVGRTLVVLAGAFLLRALTDSGQLGARTGGLVGLGFSAIWIAMADRAGARGQRTNAVFHGLAFVLIAFPLLFELTARFHLLGAGSASVSLGAGVAIGLVVVWRQQLRWLAWVISIAGVATATAMAIATAEVGPFAFVLILLGVAALWLGYVFNWTLLRWPVAFFADLAVLVLSFRGVAVGSADTAAVAFAAQVTLLVAYLGSFAARTLVLNRDVVPFEVAQTAIAALVGLGGAAHVAWVLGGGGLIVGVMTLGLALACYGVAAAFVERRQSRRRNYYVYTTAGFVFALAGAALAVHSPVVGLFYAAFGVVAAWAGRVYRHAIYRAHAAAYLVAAAATAGLLPYVAYGLGLPVPPSSSASSLALGVLTLSAAAAAGLGVEADRGPGLAARRVPRFIVFVLLLGGVLGAGVAATVTGSESSSWVATVRTALLVSAILALATAGRLWTFAEGTWLVYPLLVTTGVKFLAEDLRAGRPATLFVGFGLYGLALIMGPRLARRPPRADQKP
jgi:hypothetical protein